MIRSKCVFCNDCDKPKVVIKYTGLGSNFRTHFTEKEFREIIKSNIMFFNFNENSISNYNKYKSVITDPMVCDLDLLIEFSGAIKILH